MRTKVRRAEELIPVKTNGQSSTMWIKANSIRIDPDRQRAWRKARIVELANNWDDDAVGILHISRRKDAFYAIDGQHRIMACRLRGTPEHLLECKVYENLTKPEEARMFRGLNKQLNVRLYDDFRIALNYDPEAIAINKTIEAVGLSISDQSTDGHLTAIKACQDVYRGVPFRAKEPTPWALARALRTATGAWGKQRDAVSGSMILGLGAVHLRYGDAIDLEQLERKLTKFAGGPLAVVARAQTRRTMTKSTVWRAVAEVVVDIYNQGRRSTQLDAFNRK
jgi:hypothetical protein